MVCAKCGEKLEESACCGEVPCDFCDGTSCRGRMAIAIGNDSGNDPIGHACVAHDPDLKSE